MKVTLSKRRVWIILLCFVVLITASFTLFIASIYSGYWGKIPTVKELTEMEQHKASEVWSADGELLGKFYTTDRQPIAYSSFPKHLLDALVATEDARFYEHDGVDKWSLLRVLFKSVLLGNKSAGGGSTLSQQLAKNIFPRKDYGKLGIVVHKIREIIIANRLETAYSKEQLITNYLNTVPFSDNTFGIESAALKFFHKSAYQLTLEEAAVLIGMLKTNYYFNPRLFPEKSRTRRNTVLEQMYKYDYISKEELETASKKPLKLNYQNFSHNEGLAPYYRGYVKEQVKNWLAAYNKQHKTQLNLYHSGLKIYTTLDAGMQQKAEEAVQNHLEKLQVAFERGYGKNAPWLKPKSKKELEQTTIYKKYIKLGLQPEAALEKLQQKHQVELFSWDGMKTQNSSTADSLAYYTKFLNTGFVSLEAATGAVKTWVGGIDYTHFKYDHVSQSKRQVGSTFKPIVYAAALEQGFEPCDYVSNTTVTYKDKENWTPTNASRDTTDHRKFTLWAALANSLNVISVKLIQQVGVEATIDLAQKMGIESNLPKVPSLALGTAELSVLELAKAYTSFVNKGYYSKPYVITRIEDAEGNIMQEFTPQISTKKAFSKSTNQDIIKMMQRVTDSGTAKRLRTKYQLYNDIASKTGTTQSNKDGWYVGITPKLVNVCWVGADDYTLGFQSTKIGQGANSALPIFANWYQLLSAERKYDNYTKVKFIDTGSPINCVAFKEANFLEELFTSDKTKKKNFENSASKKDKKGGFFKRLFGRKK